MATMLRRAGLREAASEAMRDLPDPVDLDQVEAWGHGTASPETISSAVWAAAHDAVCRPPAQSAAARFTGARKTAGTNDGSAGRKDLAFVAPTVLDSGSKFTWR